MSSKKVVLINSNRMQPRVAPIALDYIHSDLRENGFDPEIVDLSFVSEGDDCGSAARALQDALRPTPLAVGITFRNTDDCFWPSAQWFVPELKELTDVVRGLTEAPVIVGGCGFSTAPERILDYCGLDLGVVGDGEAALPALLRRIEEGGDGRGVPGVVARSGDGFVRTPPRYARTLSVNPARDALDNARYFAAGGMGNIETKRGCDRQCIFCADPLIKGRVVRCRDPREVAEELEGLARQGVDVFHLCDSEFNVPGAHALAVCEEIVRRGLGEKIGWYTYAAPTPFSPDLARAMKRAGCRGINFGTDSASPAVLRGLGRRHVPRDIAEAVRLCRQAGITVMLDLMLGGPGDTRETVQETIAFVKRIDPHCAGASLGVRVYPGTGMARLVQTRGPMDSNENLCGATEDNDDFFRPVFYISRALGPRPAEFVRDEIAGDQRFFPPAPETDVENYNYNDNAPLVEAIRRGARGAFWDILRKMKA